MRTRYKTVTFNVLPRSFSQKDIGLIKKEYAVPRLRQMEFIFQCALYRLRCETKITFTALGNSIGFIFIATYHM